MNGMNMGKIKEFGDSQKPSNISVTDQRILIKMFIQLL